MFQEERLSSEKHMRSVGDFYCGADSPLDIFLQTEAFTYDEKHYGITYVLSEIENTKDILGFYTLKTSGIQFDENGEFYSIPVIELARIAIAYDLQKNGMGKYVFYKYILPKVKQVADIVAVKAIIAFVEPDDQLAIGFYKSIGFEKASNDVQKQIAESFNEECDLYIVSLDSICDLE